MIVSCGMPEENLCKFTAFRANFHPDNILCHPFFTLWKKMKRCILFIFICATACLMLSSQIVVRGIVTSDQGEAMPGVSVKTSAGALTSTKGDGSYRLTVSAAPDSLTITFSMPGYFTESRTLFSPRGQLTVNMRMRPQERQLDEVVVSDIRKRTGAMERIDAGTYSRNFAGPDGGSVEGIISTMPGVTGANELSNRYSVRGGSYDENSVYINGVEVYRPLMVTSSAQEGLSMINPDMVGGVEFSTGGFGSQYADRMSSVLDIAYRRPAAPEATISASLIGASAAFGVGSGHFSQLHGIRYRRNTSLLSTTDTKGEYDPDFFDWQSYLVWNVSGKIKMSALVNVNLNNYRFIPSDRQTSFGTLDNAKKFKVYFDGGEHDKFNTYTGAVTLDWAVRKNSTLSAEISAFRSDELVAYDISGEYWLDLAGAGDNSIGGELGVGRYHEHARSRLKATVISGKLRGATSLGSHMLTYGTGMRREQVDDHIRRWERRDSAGFSLPADDDRLNVWYSLSSDNKINSTRVSAYLQDNWRLTSGAGFFNLSGGVRALWWSYNGELVVSPRVQLGFVPSAAPAWAFRLASGMYAQAPFYREALMPVEQLGGEYVNTLNHEIKSQKSFQAIAGADFTFRALNRPFKLSAEIYYKVLSDLIPYEVDNLELIYSGINSATGHVAGFDFKLFGEFVPGSDSWLSVGLMNSSENLGGVKVPRPNDRRYSFALYFTDFVPKIPRLKVSLKGVFMDGLPTAAPHFSRADHYFRMPAYKRVDIGASYGIVTPESMSRPTWLRGLWLGVDVFNLFDISNVANYYWVTDVNNVQYAVPNYLTRRQINIKLTLNF